MDDKILIKIVENTGKITKKLCPVDANKIIIVKPKPGPGGSGWKPTFTHACIINEPGGFLGKPRRYIMVKRDAVKCLDFSDTGMDEGKVPQLTRRDIKQLFEQAVMKNAGDVNVKSKINFVQVATLGLLGFMLVLQFVR